MCVRRRVCVCVCVGICVWVHVYMQMYVCIVGMLVFVYAERSVCVCLCVCMCVCVCMYVSHTAHECACIPTHFFVQKSQFTLIVITIIVIISYFGFPGIAFIMSALVCDALIGNLQEKVFVGLLIYK